MGSCPGAFAKRVMKVPHVPASIHLSRPLLLAYDLKRPVFPSHKSSCLCLTETPRSVEKMRHRPKCVPAYADDTNLGKRGLDLSFENGGKVQRLFPLVRWDGKTKSPGPLYSLCDFHSSNTSFMGKAGFLGQAGCGTYRRRANAFSEFRMAS
jgi:hypothetical protein